MNKTLNIVSLVVLCCLWGGCNADEEDSIHEDPYAGGREPLLIKLLDEKPDPEVAGPKDRVTFQASGLERYCHPEEGKYDFKFYISDERCYIENATDSTVTITVPDALSSGPSYLVLEEQIFYGPYFKVSGSVTVDEGFVYAKTGPYNGIIYTCLPWCQNTALTSEFYLFGDISQGKGKPYGGVAMINNETGLVKYGTSGKIAAKYGINIEKYYDINTGVLYNSEIRGANYWKTDAASSRVLIYGSFDDYENYHTSLYGFSFKNLLLLNNDFSVKTETKSFLDEKGIAHSIKVPAFIGGTSEGIVRAFPTSTGKIVAVGNIFNHKKTDYENTTCDKDGKRLTEVEIMTQARSVLRMDEVGQLDLTYRRDLTNSERSLAGTTGEIKDACMLADESIVVVGDMANFDNIAIHNIVKLNKDGQVDQNFLENVGTGADGSIKKITYYQDEEHEYILIVGSFNSFNGQVAEGLIILNVDGTINQTFQFKKVFGGRPTFAKVVDLNTNGDQPMPHVIVSGTFSKYDGITRRGFLILDMNGNAIQRFNVPGEFRGELYDAQYSLTSDNTNGVLLTGSFYSFDGKVTNNIVMLKVEIDHNTTIN